MLPLINRAYILDLRPGASFVEFLLGEGFDVFLIDWGIPGDEDRALDVTTLVTRYLPRAAKAIQRTTGADQMTVLGYCIGGALATCFTALHPEVVRNLVLLTAPLDFAEAGQFGRMTARGVFPIDLLTETFPTIPGQMPDVGSKLLNPMANYVGTYRNLWQRLGDPAFDVSAWQAMYRWVNDSVPFAGAAFRQWIVEFYQDNRLTRDMLEMDGRPVRLAGIRCPVLNIAASRDQIAPRETTSVVTKRVGSKDASEIIVEGGHVGIVVGRSASQNLWPKVGSLAARPRLIRHCPRRRRDVPRALGHLGDRLADELRKLLPIGPDQLADAIPVHVRDDDLPDLGTDDREDAEGLHPLGL